MRHIGKRNKIESPEINSHVHGQLTHKGAKNIQWGKDTLIVLGKLDNCMQKSKTRPLSYPIPKTITQMD